MKYYNQEGRPWVDVPVELRLKMMEQDNWEVLLPDGRYAPKSIEGTIPICVYRCKIPTYIPWSLDTCPDLPLVVKHKKVRGQFMVASIMEEGVIIADLGLWSWYNLFDIYTKLDGSPCGEQQ